MLGPRHTFVKKGMALQFLLLSILKLYTYPVLQLLIQSFSFSGCFLHFCDC